MCLEGNDRQETFAHQLERWNKKLHFYLRNEFPGTNRRRHSRLSYALHESLSLRHRYRPVCQKKKQFIYFFFFQTIILEGKYFRTWDTKTHNMKRPFYSSRPLSLRITISCDIVQEVLTPKSNSFFFFTVVFLLFEFETNKKKNVFSILGLFV
jgi:hypothetical protein